MAQHDYGHPPTEDEQVAAVDLTLNQRRYLASLIRQDLRKRTRGQEVLKEKFGPEYDAEPYETGQVWREDLLALLKRRAP